MIARDVTQNWRNRADTLEKATRSIISLPLLIVGALLFSNLATAGNFPDPRSVSAQEWKMEFDEICSKTGYAVTYSIDELRSLVSRCDKLMPQIERLEESQRKVYAKRLRSCRELFIFVIESRKKE